MFDPQASDEVVITDDLHYFDDGTPVEVGSTFPFTAISVDGAFDEPASGPQLEMRVVGIIHSPLSYVFTGGAFLSPGFLTKYADSAYVASNAVVALRHDAADVAALRRHASSDVAEGVPVLDLHVTSRRVSATTDVEGAMLRLLGAIVALAGIASIGQALARSAATIGSDAATLRAIGMTRREMVSVAVRPHLLTAIIAVAFTTLTAIVASRWFPVGLAAGVDPDRGIQVNVAWVSIAAFLTLLMTLGVVAFSSWRASRSSNRRVMRQSVWLLHAARSPGCRTRRRTYGVRRWGRTRLRQCVARVDRRGRGGRRRGGNRDGQPRFDGRGGASRSRRCRMDASVLPAQDDVSIESGVDASLIETIGASRVLRRSPVWSGLSARSASSACLCSL